MRHRAHVLERKWLERLKRSPVDNLDFKNDVNPLGDT
jgi:hypothetical protein